ncbi:hypothetical protein GUITHDRAFT_131816 [Guillardia theta CCMP2712]|uniref:Uncharacterized protein n=1 Tax=Guillardia theta (strain CCMP2712) TaxID=905079 RepID=L1K2J9_GUITC|nr:hypothetical protein GUITHDRAFT_131816 [Guillardia theta CCMP2712]EKX54809.1 hypothetical protein GUITHDRAFT_131816 [Guillardia theta CCMP2712]|eukprot:XP_005841789.1 hypothetical protein GUITHDRAFT_131816 [Guillardia theta CCMP2712]
MGTADVADSSSFEFEMSFLDYEDFDVANEASICNLSPFSVGRSPSSSMALDHSARAAGPAEEDRESEMGDIIVQLEMSESAVVRCLQRMFGRLTAMRSSYGALHCQCEAMMKRLQDVNVKLEEEREEKRLLLYELSKALQQQSVREPKDEERQSASRDQSRGSHASDAAPDHAAGHRRDATERSSWSIRPGGVCSPNNKSSSHHDSPAEVLARVRQQESNSERNSLRQEVARLEKECQLLREDRRMTKQRMLADAVNLSLSPSAQLRARLVSVHDSGELAEELVPVPLAAAVVGLPARGEGG